MAKEGADAIAYWLIPDADHEAICRRLCDGRFAEATVDSYTYVWRYALSALYHSDPGLLDGPTEARITETTTVLIVAFFLKIFSYDDAVAAVRRLRNVYYHLTGIRSAPLTHALKALLASPPEQITRKETKTRLRSVCKEDFPRQHSDDFQRLREATKGDGDKRAEGSWKRTEAEILVWFACLEDAGVEWRDSSLAELMTKPNVQIFADAICRGRDEPWKQHQRINAFAWGIGPVTGGAAAALKVAAELRATNTSEGSVKYRQNKDHGTLDDCNREDVERLAFALRKDHRKSFRFEGRTIELPRRGGRDATIGNCYSALRVMTKALSLSAPHILAQPTTERDYKLVAELILAYFAEYPIITQIIRLDNLRSLLTRIVPGHSDLRWIDRLIRRLNRALKTEEIVVHDLKPDAILGKAIEVMERSRKRLTDLSQCKVPYAPILRLASEYRNALMVSLLSNDPLRLRSVRLLDCADFKSKPVRDQKRFIVTVDAARMKMKEDYTFIPPAELNIWIDCYFDFVRNILVNKGEGRPSADPDDRAAMWISTKNAKRLSAIGIQQAIPRFMLAQHGIAIHVQLFRRFVATELANTPDGSKRLANTRRIMIQRYVDARVARNPSRVTPLKQYGEDVIGPMLSRPGLDPTRKS